MYNMPENIPSFLDEVLDHIIANGDYPSACNKRICLVGDDTSEKVYDAKVMAGCKRFYHQELVLGDKIYWVGFNYGD